MTENPFAAYDSQAPLSVAEDVPTADDNPFAQFSAVEPPPVPERIKQTLPITPVQSMPGVSIIGEDAGINDGITAIAERNTRDGVAKMGQAARESFAQGIEREVASYRAGRPELQDASGNQFTRGLARGLTTGAEMLGGAVRQIAESAGSDKLARIGEAVQGTAALERARFPEMKVDKIADVESIGDFGNWMSGKIGEGLGSSATIFAGGAIGGWFGVAAGSWGLGVGSMRNELETAGVPQERMAEYAYIGGSVIGALDAIMPASVMNSLSGNVKQEIAKQVVRRMAVATAKGSMKEGVTEALQEAVAVAGVASARGDQEALAMLQNAAQGVYDERARIAEAGAAGAAAGSTFGAAQGAGSLRGGQTVNRSAKGDRLAQAPASGPEAASQATKAPSSQPEAGVGQIKRDAAPETRAATREQFSQYLDIEGRLAAIPDDAVAPPELINQAIDAEEAMVDTFRATGLPGDNLARGTRPIESMDDVRRAFDEATPEEIDGFWQGKAVGTAASGIDVGAGTAPAEATGSGKAASAGVTFTTARGSSYTVHEDGTTTRDKAFRPEHGAAEQGIQPRSETTFYVTPEDAIKLGEFQTSGGRKSVEKTSSGAYAMKYLDGPSAGKFEKRTVVQPKTQPEAGLIPVEVWKGGQRVHFGNAITEVGDARDLTADFLRLIATPTPRDQWAKTLGVSEDELMPHVERAIASGLLRVDRNGVVRRNAQSLAEMEPEAEAEGQKIEQAAQTSAGPLLAPGIIEGENVTLTSKAIDKIQELQAIAEEAVAKILPRDVRIEVRDNIAIDRLAHEDELLALRARASGAERLANAAKSFFSKQKDIVAFHGTNVPIERFDLGKAQIEPALFFTSSPKLAERYALVKSYRNDAWIEKAWREAEQSGIVVKNAAGGLEVADPAAMESLLGRVRQEETTEGANIVPVRLSTQDFKAIDAQGYAYDEDDGARLATMIEEAAAQGYSGLAVTNMVEGLADEGGGETNYVVWGRGTVHSAVSGDLLFSLRSSKSAKVSEGTEGESDEQAELQEGGAEAGQASNDAPKSGDAGAIAAAVGGGGAVGASTAEGRILRQESATLRSDGSIRAGRISTAGRALRGVGDAESLQQVGTSERFDAPGVRGVVTANRVSPHADLDARRAPPSEYRLANLTYRFYDESTPIGDEQLKHNRIGKFEANFRAGGESHVPLIWAMISQHMDGTWEVSSVNRVADAQMAPRGMAAKLYAAIEKDLGIRMSPSGYLSPDGYAMWQKRSPVSVQWHQKSKSEQDFYISPRRIKDRLPETGKQIKFFAAKMAEDPGDARAKADWEGARKERVELIALWDKLPLEARGATPNTMFSLRSRISDLFGRGTEEASETTKTRAFKRWFGASKAVDADGAPLRVYHGTQADIEAFDPARADGGIFFSSAVDVPNRYAERGGEGANVIPAYVKIENPAPTYQAFLDEPKYDGYFSHQTYVVRTPEQVKSVFNRGTFDPNDPRIGHAMREGGQILGQTNPDAKLISLGARAIEAEARAKGKTEKKVVVETARHEALEFFLAKGFIKTDEWTTLTDAARAEDWIDAAGVREPYTAKFGETMDAVQLEDLILKESIMVKYGEYEQGNYKPKGLIAKVFKRIKDFLDRLRNSLKSQGFQRWEDIFQKMDAGEMRQRYEARFGAPAAESKSLVTSKAVPAGGKSAMTIPKGARNAPLSPGMPGAKSGLAPSAPGSLVDIQRNLRRKLGLPVAKGRLDPKMALAAGQMGEKPVGQFDAQTGVIRLAVLEDIESEAHEVAHALEDRYSGLAGLQQAHAQELDGVAASTGNTGLSEGFAEFFRLYLTNPGAADAHAPRFRAAFENFIENEDAQTLQDIQEIQAQYQQWRDASSAGRITAAIKTGVPKGTWEEIESDYQKGGMTRIKGRFSAFLDRAYRGVFDKANPIAVWVRRAAEIAEENNQDLDLSAWRNPHMQAGKIPLMDSAAYMDITRGVGWANSAGRGSVSLNDALATAFGGRGFENWTPEQRDAFGAYLIARRGRWLWQRHDMDPARNRGRMASPPQNPQDGDWYFDTMARQRRVYLRGRWEAELPRAPDKHSRADHEMTVAELEAANPGFSNAAQMVYQFNRDLALKRFQAGLDSQDEFDYKNGASDYVPWFRDMTDTIFSGTAASGRKVQGKFKIRGSYRDFINPVEGIIRQVYDTNREIAVNKPKLLMAQIADQLKGAGRLAEIIPAMRMEVQEVRVRDALAQAAREEGIPTEDAKDMISAVAAMLGDDAVAKIFKSKQAGEGGDAILHYMDGGELKMLQIHDDEHGLARDIIGFFEVVKHTPMADGLFKMIAAGVRIPIKLVTSSVEFAYNNLIRDTMSASVLQAGFFPVASQLQTIRDNRARRARGEETWGEILARHGGIMGGMNTTHIRMARQGRVLDLGIEGAKYMPWDYRFWTRTVNDGFWNVIEAPEGSTRQTLARLSFDRAIKDVQATYPTMPPDQQTFVALEAAVQKSRDYVDYSRMGDLPTVAGLVKLFAFLGPYLQGIEKSARATLRAQDNQGQYQAAQILRKKIAPLFDPEWLIKQHKPGGPDFQNLTKAQVGALKGAAYAWVGICIIATTQLMIEILFNDEDELEDKSQLERASSVSFTVNGLGFRIPRGFDIINVVSNAVRATYASWKREDPTAWKQFRQTLGVSLMPPTSSPLLDLYIGWKHERNNFFNSPIEQEHQQGLLPEDRYTAYTSNLSRRISEIANPAMPFDVSPVMVEYSMNAIGSQWSRDILRTYDVLDPSKPAIKWQDYPFIRGARGLRGSRGAEEFWDLMGQEGKFAQSAGSYTTKEAKNWDRDSIRRFFDVRLKDDDAKAYAIMKRHYDPEQRRLHPLIRAHEMTAAVSGVMRDVSSNNITVAITSKIDRKPEISREVRGQAMDILAEVNRREYRNALIALKRPGYENRNPQPVKPYLEELKALSPDIHRALIGKINKSKGPTVYDYDRVREAWPDIRRKVLSPEKRERIIESEGDVEFSDLIGRAQGPKAMGIR